MPLNLLKTLLSLLVLVSLNVTGFGAEPGERVGGLKENQAGTSSGYTLVCGMWDKAAFLINNESQIVHSWNCEYYPGCSTYLMENGDLLRTGALLGPHGNPVFGRPGAGGRVQRISWDGEVLWDYSYSTFTHMSHHDVEVLPNGNILILAWERHLKKAVLEAGRDPEKLLENELWPDTIVEVKPTGLKTGEVVWKWSLWDHLVQDFDPSKKNYGNVSEHPELYDINYSEPSEKYRADWPHANSISYNSDLDQILVTFRSSSELIVIDHSTTTEEAAGHTGGRSGKGGDILYRWGNPQAYKSGTIEDQKLFFPHDAKWIPKGLKDGGKIIVFNNGVGRPDGNRSAVEVIATPVNSKGEYAAPQPTYGPESSDWTYSLRPQLFAAFSSGVQRLANGNTLITSGTSGVLIEVDYDGNIVWEFHNPDSPYEKNAPPEGLVMSPGIRRPGGPGGPGGPRANGPGGRRSPGIPGRNARPPGGAGQGPGGTGGPGGAGPGADPPGIGPAVPTAGQRHPVVMSKGSAVFKALKYGPDFPAFQGKDLKPGEKLNVREEP